MCLRLEMYRQCLRLLCSGTCSLNFFSDSNDLEGYFECVNVSEDDVGRRQTEEDIQLYGGRPQPSDLFDIDDSAEQTKERPKRNLSELQPVDDRPAKLRKTDEPGSDAAQCVTAMDWNSGASPLDSWLNQSAIPSLVPAINQDLPQISEIDLIAREAEELKAFRTVHIAIITQAAGTSVNRIIDEDFASLDLGAQIYYRNIKDRYPKIPNFLARRLAEANLDRTERLRAERLRAERLRAKRRHRTEMSKQPDNDHQSQKVRSSPEGFWHGGRPTRRPPSTASLHSRSSSMNSSLRGSEGDSSSKLLDSTSHQNNGSSRGLPPPPVPLGRSQAFRCDICGETIYVEKRRQWQSV